MSNQSEVARIRKQIEQECIAMHNAMLFSKTATHEAISHRFKCLDRLGKELELHVPAQEAIGIIVQIYDQNI